MTTVEDIRTRLLEPKQARGNIRKPVGVISAAIAYNSDDGTCRLACLVRERVFVAVSPSGFKQTLRHQIIKGLSRSCGTVPESLRQEPAGGTPFRPAAPATCHVERDDLMEAIKKLSHGAGKEADDKAVKA
jgi:hypothetical protein